MSTNVKLINDKYTVKLPVSAALDFASYFINNGVPVLYECYGYDESHRSIEFTKDTANVNIMLAWVQRWEGGHNYCPFCGGVPEVYETEELYAQCRSDVSIPLTHIRCTKCGCMTDGIVYAQDDHAAWDLWDKRV